MEIIIFKMKFLIAATFSLLLGLTTELKCSQGSIPNSSNVCISPDYIQGCYQYSSDGSCQTCNFNYVKNENGLCSYIPESNSKCCLREDQNGNCLQCNKGLSLINGGCEDIQILGCLEKNQNAECVNCAKGFHLENGKCRSGVKNCRVYSNKQTNFCLECEDNYSLISNNCLKNKILGCKKQQVGSCLECYPPFTKLQNHCEIKQCKTYSDFGCVACECGYYITKNRVCEKIQQGCIRHQKGICTDCYHPFQLQGASCVLDGCLAMEGIKCTKCNPQYEIVNGYCMLPNCLQGSNGKCKICKPGFNYQKGACLKSSNKLIFD